MSYNIHKLIDTAMEDGPMIAVVGIALYIGYRILVDKKVITKAEDWV